MKRVYFLVLLACLSGNANALEVAGVSVPERAQSGEQLMVLNGAASRLMVGMFNVYVIALYLPEKKHTIAEVLDAGLSKRMTLKFLYGVTSQELLEATNKLMSENLSAEEFKNLDASWKEFAALFEKIKDINKDDYLALDYHPATGTRVSLNGKEIGRVADAKFMRAFLLVWLGDNPAQADFKVKLLGLSAADGKR